ncbi:hypothetical protein POKO110462_20510 [Pontibacter korlensis]
MSHHIEWFKKKTKFIPWLKPQVLGLSLAFSRKATKAPEHFRGLCYERFVAERN